MFNQTQFYISEILRWGHTDKFWEKRWLNLLVPSLSLGTRLLIVAICWRLIVQISGEQRNLRVSVSKDQAKSEIKNLNLNLLKLRLLVVDIELLINMWFISQIDFCFGNKWRY